MRKTGLLNAILKFDFTGKDFMDRVRVFEDMVRTYNKRLEGGRELDEDVKIATVVGGAKGELRKQLTARAPAFRQYSDLIDHLQEYQCSGQYSRYMNTMQPSQTDRMALDRDYKPMDCGSQVNISANDTVFDRLSNNRKNKYQSFEKQRVQKEMKDCSFQPLIQP